MYFSTVVSLFLAALATAAPSSSQGNVDARDRGLVTFVMTEPNCPSLESYCTNCNGSVPISFPRSPSLHFPLLPLALLSPPICTLYIRGCGEGCGMRPVIGTT
ncbi:hypothetical protein GGR51DRAFT_455952 [Nemania sp. FL0031]|nr:hypothetical protein GGR51DRAFT_455952 [Nemania sp. FL0031]